MSPGHYPSLRLTHEYRNLRDDLFRAMPQNPHYQPLQKLCAGVCENIKVGLDVVFINLALKMVKLSSPLELSSSDVMEEFIATLTQLEEMGYDCAKLWAKFDTLRAISAEEGGVVLGLEETTSKRRNKQVEATTTRTRISELEAELKKLKTVLETEEKEIEILKFTERSPIEEREQIWKNFRSAATAPW
ncbi:hypothetical protein MKW98_019505 [Papaver atlanticum]|uniref:Uncharacterized protein n=1 Tax=Papaver atlanticum TaxID=357466 RepID=A0AAD4S8E4_9MAGN|nr:hypothetical protein MKW98_019505 [Papaver atlanticum]